MLTFLIVVTAIIITARVSAMRTREAEAQARNVRRKAHFALETELLTKGPGEVWPNLAPDAALRSLRSLGNVGYLVWLLNCEPLYRDHRGQGDEQYPPDWELRRGFVFLRDRNKCQGYRCGAASSLGYGLDCHHIKPISEFGPEEIGIHALSNLVTLCPICHPSQHPGNTMLVERATKSSSRELKWHPYSTGRKSTLQPKLSSPGQFDAPRKIEVHSHLRGQLESSNSEPGRTEKEYRPEIVADVQVRAFSEPSKSLSQGSVGKNEQQDARKAKSITEGLAVVDERAKAADAGLQLEGLQKRLKETPYYKTFERRLLQMQIDNLRNRIRADHGVEPLTPKTEPELTKQVMQEAKNAKAADSGRKENDGVPGIPKPPRVGGIPQPPKLGMSGYAGAKRGGTATGSAVARAPVRLEHEEAETKPQRSKWKLSLHTDSSGVVSLDWGRFDAGKREEAATSEGAHHGMQLEDHEKRLVETSQHPGVGGNLQLPKVEVPGYAINKRPGAATIRWAVCIKNLEVGKMQLITPDMSVDPDDPRWDREVHIVPVTENPEKPSNLDFGVHDFVRNCACHPKIEKQRFGRTIISHQEAVN
jgi:5-methylcytosine-specific restriction endonuclease McrA